MCKFCDKISQYKKGTNTRETFRCCYALRVDERIKKVAVDKHDSKLIRITSDELIAKEAWYHPSCYKLYTKPEKEVKGMNDTMKIDILKETVNEVISVAEGHVIYFDELQKKYLKNLEDRNFEISQAKKNLRRSIERNITNIRFVNVDEKDVICSKSTTFEDILSLLFKKQRKLEELKNVEENIYSAARAIRKDCQECDYCMSWSPSNEELDMESFPIPASIQRFLSLVISNEILPRNDENL